MSTPESLCKRAPGDMLQAFSGVTPHMFSPELCRTPFPEYLRHMLTLAAAAGARHQRGASRRMPCTDASAPNA
eukprot:13409131-Alexandrium_andersonii.AAC.1